MVVVSDQDEEEFIQANFKSGTQYNFIYIGAERDLNGNTFHWLNGEPFTYHNWDLGQPDNPEEMCVVTSTNGFHDAPCYFSWPLICEI